MIRPNLNPIARFQDGSQVYVSTTYRGERMFACQLYLGPLSRESAELRPISEPFEASTCREAQETAYRYAIRLNAGPVIEFQKPPYLIWGGPAIPVEPDWRGRPSRYRP